MLIIEDEPHNQLHSPAWWLDSGVHASLGATAMKIWEILAQRAEWAGYFFSLEFQADEHDCIAQVPAHEIAALLGLTRKTVYSHLSKLVALGVITRVGYRTLGAYVLGRWHTSKEGTNYAISGLHNYARTLWESHQTSPAEGPSNVG